jgi:YDG domain
VTGLSITGADANNYALMGSSFTAQASILPRSLNIVATAQDKVYDGSTTATGALGASNIVSGDALQLSWNPGQFASKDVSRNAQGQVQAQGVSFGNVQMAGADVGNYSLGQSTANTTATITPKALQTVGTVVADKPEDGNTTAKVTVGSLVGLVGAEQLTATAAGSFESATAGNDKAVDVVYSLQDGANGGKAGNYEVQGQVLKGSILPTGKSNPVQPIIVPVKPGAGGSKVVIAQAQAAVPTAPKTSQSEGREECSILSPEKCECRDAAIAGVEICVVPRERLTQADLARVSQLQVPKAP